MSPLIYDFVNKFRGNRSPLDVWRPGPPLAPPLNASFKFYVQSLCKKLNAKRLTLLYLWLISEDKYLPFRSPFESLYFESQWKAMKRLKPWKYRCLASKGGFVLDGSAVLALDFSLRIYCIIDYMLSSKIYIYFFSAELKHELKNWVSIHW